jgi:DNA-binding NtrC family response regulator
MPGSVQVKLLRTLESRKIPEARSRRRYRRRIRILAATNRDLEKESRGRIPRTYYRLNVIYFYTAAQERRKISFF